MKPSGKVRACETSDGSWRVVPPTKVLMPPYEKLGMDPLDGTLQDLEPRERA